MAIQKTRLRAKTRSGIDTIHLETSSDLVVRPDGSSVEEGFGKKLNGINTWLSGKVSLDDTVEPGVYMLGVTSDSIGLPPEFVGDNTTQFYGMLIVQGADAWKWQTLYWTGGGNPRIRRKINQEPWSSWEKSPIQFDLDTKANANITKMYRFITPEEFNAPYEMSYITMMLPDATVGPYEDYWSVDYTHFDASNGVQEISGITSGKKYYRVFYARTAGAWQRIVTENDLASKVDVGTVLPVTSAGVTPAAGLDADNFVMGKMYCTTSAAQTATVAHRPLEEEGVSLSSSTIFILPSSAGRNSDSDNWCIQFWIARYQLRAFFRHKDGATNGYGKWKEFATIQEPEWKALKLVGVINSGMTGCRLIHQHLVLISFDVFTYNDQNTNNVVFATVPETLLPIQSVKTSCAVSSNDPSELRGARVSLNSVTGDLSLITDGKPWKTISGQMLYTI